MEMIAASLENNLTHIRWLSDMFLEQDFGKLNFSQIEYLAEVDKSCESAIKHLQKLLRKQGIEPSSKNTLQKRGKKKT